MKKNIYHKIVRKTRDNGVDLCCMAKEAEKRKKKKNLADACLLAILKNRNSFVVVAAEFFFFGAKRNTFFIWFVMQHSYSSLLCTWDMIMNSIDYTLFA